MTRIWKIIAFALSSAYLLQLGTCNFNPGHGFSFITNIPGGQTLAQWLQTLGLTT